MARQRRDFDRHYLHRLLDSDAIRLVGRTGVKRERHLVQRLRNQRCEIVGQRRPNRHVSASADHFGKNFGKGFAANCGGGMLRMLFHPLIPQYHSLLRIEHDDSDLDGFQDAFKQIELEVRRVIDWLQGVNLAIYWSI